MTAAHHRHHVDAERGGPALLVIGLPETRGVVDEDIEPAERLHGLRHIGRDLIGVSEIDAGSMGGDAERLDLLARRFQRPGPACADRDGRPARGEAERDRAADATAAAHDDHALAGEFPGHLGLPFLIDSRSLLAAGRGALPRLAEDGLSDREARAPD